MIEKALVVFTHSDTIWSNCLLKRGFKHCFVCVLSNGLWIRLDVQYNIPVVYYLTTEDFDLEGFYKDQGAVVIKVKQRKTASVTPLLWRNCVGMVKAILNIHSWAITPYGLYRYLKRYEI